MRIDCQSHVFPAEYAEILTHNPVSPRATPRGAGYLVVYDGLQTFQLDLATYSIDRKLRDMDRAGVDVSVLSMNMPGPELLAPELGVVGARICNDCLADIVGRYPDRFVGLACLPWQDVQAAIVEATRAINSLGLRGIMLYSHIGTDAVDNPKYELLYEHIEALGVPIVLHPCVSSWAKEIREYSMIPMVGLMIDQSFAMLRLILGGVLERHSGLTIVQPHAGGILPYLWGRIEHQTTVMGRGRENISQPPSVYYRRVYLDTVTPSAPALRFAYDFAGADRLVFGSDHPWVEISRYVRMVEDIDIPAQDKRKIFGSTAQRLFRID